MNILMIVVGKPANGTPWYYTKVRNAVTFIIISINIVFVNSRLIPANGSPCSSLSIIWDAL